MFFLRFNAPIFYKFINGDDMKIIKIALTSIFLVISSYASATTISANVALSSDYIWRGITQTNGDAALSGGFDLEAGNGFYFGTWASNANVGAASLELDIYLGFAGEMAENMTYDIGYISVMYPGNDAADFEEAYIAFNFYGLNILYSDGQNNGPSYSEIAYSVDAGPGAFNISYGEYEDTGDNTLVGYDWGVGDFTIGFYYFDYEDDGATVTGDAPDDDGAYVSISRSF
tara:strand:+ start:8505 stop:9194 length:690 start_codon:yes stop_codon:yes gene_type:complete